MSYNFIRVILWSVCLLLFNLEIISCSSGTPTGYHFEEIQSIPANGGRDFRYFTIGEDRFLALAETWDGTTPDIYSQIFRWDGSQFSEFQSIPTNWATEWEYFSIGEEHYLVVANSHTVGNFDIDSKIYRWNGESFEEFQSIPTQGASGWKFFTIEGNSYLVVANNGGNYNNYNVDSEIFIWNGMKFVHFQSIPTNAALRWEFFEIDDDAFLAVANYSTDFTTTFNIDSEIYRWDGSQFVHFQSVPTNGAHYWKYFTISDNHYLAVANLHSGPNRTNLEIESIIYRWDGSEFVEYQAIPTTGAVSWDFASFNGKQYLAVASWKNDNGSFQIDSSIYRWNGLEFKKYLTVTGNGASDCAFFIIDDNLYLGVANVGGINGPQVDSKIYQLETGKSF